MGASARDTNSPPSRLGHVREAGVFWLVIPTRESTGAWVELGAALEVAPARRRVGRLGANRTSPHPAHYKFDSHEEALGSLAALMKPARQLLP